MVIIPDFASVRCFGTANVAVADYSRLKLISYLRGSRKRISRFVRVAVWCDDMTGQEKCAVRPESKPGSMKMEK